MVGPLVGCTEADGSDETSVADEKHARLCNMLFYCGDNDALILPSHINSCNDRENVLPATGQRLKGDQPFA